MLDVPSQSLHRQRGSGAYPERRAPEPGSVDRFLTESYGKVAAHFEMGSRALARRADRIEALAGDVVNLSDAELRSAAEALRGPFLRHGFEPDLVDRCFALVRETAARQLGKRHYPVQLMGGLALMDGRLAEMRTGEGKTLTASLAAATAALAGMPTHVVTVNDYLAERDAEELRPLYEALGLTVGVVQHGQSPQVRRAAYNCDIAYGVNKEITFDYLRDGMALGRRRKLSSLVLDRMALESGSEPQLFLRGLYFAIVDEADSIFIDEARTPLILACRTDEEGQDELYRTGYLLSEELVEGDDFTLIKARRQAKLTEAGSAKVKSAAEGRDGLWQARRGREELITQALAARHLYQRDKQYAVIDGEVQIIDEFTGRIAEGRQWQNGLHQLIEVKEGCDVTSRNFTQSSITYQRFFRRYLHLAGMSGTLAETAGELRAAYGLRVVRIPTNRPEQRRDMGTRLYRTGEAKRRAVLEAACAQRARGRPVLIGTRTVAESERLAELFTAEAIECVVLNAHHDKEEAAIVARAGEPGRITIATNMAGRGTDIKLAPGVAAAGGLHVVITEFSESRRVDRQLIGRGGRQGDPSTYEAIVTLDDELFRTFAPGVVSTLAKSLGPGDGPFEARWAHLLRRRAQSRAQRMSYRERQNTIRSQRQLDKSLGFASVE
jgi:preprotein translocase subunit SecA